MTDTPNDLVYDHFLEGAGLSLCGHRNFAAEHCGETECPNYLANCPRHWLGRP
jgi:hypothetical protein